MLTCHTPSVCDPVLMVFTHKFWSLYWNANVWQLAICSQPWRQHGTLGCCTIPA